MERAVKKRKSIIYVTALAWIVCVLGLRIAKAEDPVFNVLSTHHGLSHNTVFAIIQDKKGFMWFGTREGLNRYDGTSIVTFYADPTDPTRLHSNHITALGTGSDDRLYVGTSRGLHVYNDKEGSFRPLLFNDQPIGNVHRMITSSDGTLMITSARGLFALQPSQSTLSQLISNMSLTNIVEFKRRVFWVSTLQKIFMVNEFGDVLKEYTKMEGATGLSISMDENVFRMFKDSFGNLWVGSKKNGLFKYDVSTDSFRQVVIHNPFNPLEVNALRVITEGPDKKLWFGTEHGLFIYDPGKGSFQHYTQSYDESPGTLSDKAIYAIYKSKEGIMWIGTYFGGVNIVKPHENSFKTLKADGGQKQLSGRAVSDIIQDRHGRIWIATEDRGISIWDRTTGSISYLRNEVGKNSLTVNNIHCIYEDDHDVFWIGTFLGGINKYDLKNKTFTIYKKSQEEKASFPNNMIYSIVKDRTGEMWVGTTAGLNKFDRKKGTYDWFMPQNFKGKFIHEIYQDKAGGLWICAIGNDSLFYYDVAAGKLSKFRYHDPTFAYNQGTTCALEDSKGNMWFGTLNRGVIRLNRSDNTFTVYNKSQGLPNDCVYGILEDDHGNLWISTNKGLSKFDPAGKKFTNYNISHGLPDNQFNFRSAFKDRNGWMYFGSINGLCYFHPDSLTENGITPTTYFTDLKLFNKSVPVGPGGILESDIDDTREIVLSHSDNVFTVEFGSINYYSSGDNRYAYYLDGFEKDWNFVSGKNSATYTNLSPGEYTLKVKSANNDGIWSGNVKELTITVQPPFWLTKWAMLLYGVFVVALFFAYRAFLRYRNREKMAIQLSRMEREKLQEINQHKLNFFTYISHEFKTPLTLMMVSIDKFLQDRSLNEEQAEGYRSIKGSAKRLHSLVDQLMDFRKIEADHAQLSYAKGDIVMFLRDTFMAFAPLFNKKHICFYFNSDVTSFHTFFDADKLEKIVTNLVSNAAKYTTENGVIEMETSVKVSKEGSFDTLKMSFHDSGVGIEPTELKNAFLPFYQTAHARKSGSGTGIGLALVKSLVDFQNGTIELDSKQQAGTQVTVTLPLPRYIDHEKVVVLHGNKTIDLEHVLPGNASAGQHEQTNSASQEYQLMIVEDSEELSSFLEDHFDEKYKIVKASNGVIALDKIKRSAPDVIISDVMMPEMDGIELCKAVKDDINTSHIPVIMLTAKTTPESRLDGLNYGADAYITKPFSLKELELVIKNLLKTRDKLRAHFLKFGQVKDAETTFTNRDQGFILKLTDIVEKHLDDSEFSITRFAKEAGVSRTLLHLKLKKVVNLSASEFIRNIRLQKAAMLLKTTDHSIGEIAYKVGYSDSNYFSRSFKEKYQVNPSDFKQQSATQEA